MTTQQEQPKQETHIFKAEVRQVLDIVIHSLYTHREIFIRELISNAADALEKMRHEALIAEEYADKDAPYEISITTDKDAHTFTITDTGIGMAHDELIQNLGTIARSGTREFIEKLKADRELETEMIGRFGVGFYSAFMVASEVKVLTRSYRPGAHGYEWISDGAGEYRIETVDDLPRGTSITLTLKEEAHEYDDSNIVKNVIQKYSNFVPFPISVNGEKVNTVQAIWTKSASELKDDEYTEFFKFISNSTDEPLSKLHLSTDAPIQLSALLYIPSMNMEQFGFMKMKPSVNLYSRRVLIQEHTDKLLPEYMRFVTGVVESADLPLNISRETLQDNLVFRKMSKFLTRRVIKHLADEAKNRPDEYATIWERFGNFIKEGVSTDFENRADLAALLRYESSATEPGKRISLDEYAARMKEEQKAIYYLNGRSREDIERGPYVEAFRKQGIEVLYLFEPVDDFVLASLGEHGGKPLTSADSADVELPEASDADKEADAGEEKLSAKEVTGLAAWMKETLGDKVTEVRESKRPTERPAIVVNPDPAMTTTMRRIMHATGHDSGMPAERILEINPRHPLILRLEHLRSGAADKGFLQEIARQICDNAMTEAGLLDDPKDMVARMYKIMDKAMGEETE